MKTVPCLALWLCLISAVQAREGGHPGDPRGIFLSEIPTYPGNVILGRPTDHSVTANVMLNREARARIVYGAEGQPEQRTDVFTFAPGEPREVVLDALPGNSACSYRLLDDSNKPLPGLSGSFHTCRGAGSAFTFTIQADSHLDGGCLPEIYTATLGDALASKPDFHIDLGDTFMTGKIPDRTAAARQYLAQRYYLGLIGHAAPLFLVLGNHDGEEAGQKGADKEDPLAAWSCRQRTKYFSNPIPDAFYGGNPASTGGTCPLQDYYAWEWGDALLVVLDPYWYSRGNRGGREPWNMTLGKPQYDWLARLLRTSKAKFKFVFIHQLVGGLEQGGRGGAEAASLYEWGGHERDGRDTFAANRPGWDMPIHDLLVETRVSVVFHGHDHFFAHQEQDGIVYQLVPQPSHRNDQTLQAEEYGYLKGDFFPSSGSVRVAVSATSATVDYVQAGSATFSYTIQAKQQGDSP